LIAGERLAFPGRKPERTPVAILLHDQPDPAVAEDVVTVVKHPIGMHPALWLHFTTSPAPD
jgi:hypothetical protein